MCICCVTYLLTVRYDICERCHCDIAQRDDATRWQENAEVGAGTWKKVMFEFLSESRKRGNGWKMLDWAIIPDTTDENDLDMYLALRFFMLEQWAHIDQM